MELSESSSKTTHQLSLPISYSEKLFEVHEHTFISGPRSKCRYEFDPKSRETKWVDRRTVRHSHPGGGVSHTHPQTGPAFYSNRKPKNTSKPSGEQLEYIAATEEESSFELIITDSALINGKIPIGDMPVDQIHMPAADRMVVGSRLKCIVRDDRKR